MRRSVSSIRGAAGAIAIAWPPRVNAVGDPAVVIVGAGIAGLTCALELADHGIASNVYEASAPFPTTFDNFTAEGAVLDAISVYDWIESRVPGGHSSPLGMLLDTAYAIEYGADTRDQASLNLIYLLAFQPKRSLRSVFGESDERSHIRGGNQQLPEAIADYLELEAVFPGLTPKWNDKAILSLPQKSPFFRASYSFYRVGQYKTFAGYEAVRQGGVLLAASTRRSTFRGSWRVAPLRGSAPPGSLDGSFPGIETPDPRGLAASVRILRRIRYSCWKGDAWADTHGCSASRPRLSARA
jgi:hypothetical protein